MSSDAQKRANAKQDATRKRVAIWLDPETAALLDKRRKKLPRAEFIRRLINASDKVRVLLKGILDRDTGLLAPGKDAPAAGGQPDREERSEKYDAWIDAKIASARAALQRVSPQAIGQQD